MADDLAAVLTESASKHAERTAIRLGDRTLTYAQLAEQSARLATVLAERGVEPGDRVGVMLPNVPEFPVAYYAVLTAGAIVVPMNILLKQREVSYFLEDSGAKLLWSWHECAAEARTGADQQGAETVAVEPGGLEEMLAAAEPTSPASVDEDDTAVLLYTSGTTGPSKGAELTHANLVGNARAVAETIIEVGPSDVVLGALPMFHSFGQTASLNAALSAGASLTLLPRWDPGHALETIQRDGATVFQGVPTMYSALYSHPERQSFNSSSLRCCMSGGASMPLELIRGFEGAFGCTILESYGLSETSPVACSNKPGSERKAGSIGQPVRDCEMAIADDDGNPLEPGEVGEVLIRGPLIMKGYWQRPEATAEAKRDGWFHSGDLGRCDDDGYFYIVDRKKDLIIRGGYNVYPREVEEVLYEHPDVLECAVLGIPHTELGEEIGAAVVRRPDTEPSEEELRAFVRDRIAAYKYPRHVWFLDELPKGPTGKILKRAIDLPSEIQTEN